MPRSSVAKQVEQLGHNKCSDRSMEVRLLALLGNYDPPTIRQTVWVTGKCYFQKKRRQSEMRLSGSVVEPRFELKHFSKLLQVQKHQYERRMDGLRKEFGPLINKFSEERLKFGEQIVVTDRRTARGSGEGRRNLQKEVASRLNDK